jgi:hypothetical protein
MRFACQSCGKAYNLPEEKIAEKSNVKLKCRVCGAIVEVKKQGELVAQVLDEGEGRRGGRVSEAPAPLASITPDEADEATQAIALSDAGLPLLPPMAPTGFSPSVLNPTPIPPPMSAESMLRSEQNLAAVSAMSAVAPPPVPLPPPPLRTTSTSPPLPPPPVPPREAIEAPVLNGNHSMSNGNSGGFRLPDVLEAPLVSNLPAVPNDVASAEAALSAAPVQPATTEGLHTNGMLMAAFATGVLIGIIVALAFL